jgi:hypothetical protein
VRFFGLLRAILLKDILRGSSADEHQELIQNHLKTSQFTKTRHLKAASTQKVTQFSSSWSCRWEMPMP